jgi:hypothetical protein
LNNWNSITYYECCSNTSQQLNDFTFWEPNGGNITFCACGTPSVQGVWGGEAIQNGSCGDCQCYDIIIDNRDVLDSDENAVRVYYQCCDGTFNLELTGGNITRCANRIMGLFIVFRGNIIPPLWGSSYVSTGQGSCTNCVNCGQSC